MKPKRNEELRADLDKYTHPAHPEYDPEFAREMRAKRPDWFTEEAAPDPDAEPTLERLRSELRQMPEDLKPKRMPTTLAAATKVVKAAYLAMAERGDPVYRKILESNPVLKALCRGRRSAAKRYAGHRSRIGQLVALVQYKAPIRLKAGRR